MNTIKWNDQIIKLNRLNVICGENLRDNARFFNFLCRIIAKNKSSELTLFSPLRYVDVDELCLIYDLNNDDDDVVNDFFIDIENTNFKNLFIEYPETLLHPKQQTQFARLLVKKLNSNKDVSIFILTHSDYIIKELNNLMILNYELTKEEMEYCDLTRVQIMEKHGYSKEECLSKNDVCAFHVTGNNVYPEKITDLGFSIKSIDDEINRMSRMWDDLTDAMECAYE